MIFLSLMKHLVCAKACKRTEFESITYAKRWKENDFYKTSDHNIYCKSYNFKEVCHRVTRLGLDCGFPFLLIMQGTFLSVIYLSLETIIIACLFWLSDIKDKIFSTQWKQSEC